MAYYFLFLVCVGSAAADRWHLGSALGYPRPEGRLLFRRERDVCVGVVTPPLTLAVQMVTATEVREGRLGSVVHERLPMVLTRELRAPSSWIDDHIVGVAAASGASLRESLSSRRLLLVAIGSGSELRLQVRYGHSG